MIRKTKVIILIIILIIAILMMFAYMSHKQKKNIISPFKKKELICFLNIT
ncbi:hypothetical protein HMPREF0772_11342 [Staphylococcus aureus subsp. aureus TCH60]|nr:hypothetical protein HMPREF0772_11342 [Staphylococcus aureus subsp. aureus TCH60]